MTCPQGHKADKERTYYNEITLFCVPCGWRLTVKIVKNHRKRWMERRRTKSLFKKRK